MRGTRWLLLVAIATVLGFIGVAYRAQKRSLRAHALPRPQALPEELSAAGEKFRHTVKNENTHCLTAVIEAAEMRQVKDSSHIDLTDVTLQLYHDCGATYDLVRSAAATFYPADQHLYSEGAVEITRGIPVNRQPAHTLTSIKSAGGVTFDAATGHAETERPSSFVFQNGDGEATGASYDPESHNLLMKNDVVVNWKASTPHAKPVKIEAGSAEYRESEEQIQLKPWGRMTRENSVVEGENPVVFLRNGGPDGRKKLIQKIDTSNAHGTDTYPNRKLQYSANHVVVEYDDEGQVQKVTADGNAHLVSTSETAETTTTANHVELSFEEHDHESTLARVDCSGQAVVHSRPLPGPGRQLSETHILRSETIDMKMRPGGREIESVTTHAPGTIEFLPNLPVQHHRTLEGRDMVIAYGALNRIDTFRASDVKTRTDPNDEDKKHNRTTSVTASKELVAHFDPRTSRIATMEQSGDFTYQEGDRKARAAKGSLDANQNVMLLDTAASVSDATGYTSADHVRMNESTGDFTAEGNVNSSRLPDKDQKKNSQMLSGDEPVQARARKMESANRNRSIHYEGDALMWQGANRIQADSIDVDREKRGLIADGHVVSSLWEQPKDEQKKKAATPVLTVVHAPHLVYTDANRLAYYTGGVLLNRGGIQVKSRELRAYLADSQADSQLEKAFADGAVEIFQQAKGRTRTGTAEHGEYYTGEQKVVLKGGKPQMVDSLMGTGSGPELIYFANDDRLLGSGDPNDPVNTRIQKKKQPAGKGTRP